MRHALVFLLASLALPAQAGGTKDDYLATRPSGGTEAIAQPDGPSPEQDPVQRFVESNVTETLYHELGHVLIDQLDLPVFGPEEFAADMFALVMIDQMHEEEETMQIAYDVAAAYSAGAVKERRTSDNLAMWDVHGTDEQRYYNVACLIYGANPEERRELVRELDLPDERAETCEEEYAMTAYAWGEVLDHIAEDAPGHSLKIDWTLDAESPLTKFVGSLVDRLNEIMVLPEEVSVSVIPCGEVNAFYDPGPSEIIICTEMGDYLADLAN